MADKVPLGIYDAFLDSSLQDLLSENIDLRTVLMKIDPSEQPSRYAAFLVGLID